MSKLEINRIELKLTALLITTFLVYSSHYSYNKGGVRKVIFQNNEFYHIYNRGVDKRKIFCCPKDYIRFIIGMREFNQNKPIESLYRLNYLKKKGLTIEEAELPIGSSASRDPLIKILCYTLIPNHYHILIQQIAENGIVRFMHKLGTSYTKYFNFKYNRNGVLFQGKYKSIHLQSDSELLRTSSYINGNAEIHKIAKAENYPWSSHQDYIGKRNGTLCNKKIILDQFENIKEYKDLTKYIIKESQTIKNEI